jgi:glycyl-tRNA synthetase
MFINYKRGHQQAREKLPFALAQIGKVLRNEISPRRGMTRLREYTIMELELFFDPENPTCPWYKDASDEEIRLLTEEMEAEGEKTPLEITVKDAVDAGHILTQWQAYFIALSQRFVTSLGVPPDRQRFRAHLPEERSHYSSQTHDHEVQESWGWIEIAGHAYRTDYDLKAHQKGAGTDMTALRDDGTRFVPHVVEPSFGCDRLFYMTLEAAYERKDKRNVFRLPREIAPIQASVLPLVTKDGLPEKAREVHKMLLESGLVASYDESGSVGRRYARSDEIGTPLAVTIDYVNTMEKDVVTIRDRDSWDQVMLPIGDLVGKLGMYYKGEIEFTEIGEPI